MAEQLPGAVGAELIGAARGAFLRGVQLCAAISAVGSVALAVFAGIAFRAGHPAAGGGAEPDAEPPLAPSGGATQEVA